MKSLLSKKFLISTALVLGVAAVSAQTNGSAATGTAAQPTTSIGVTPQAAAEATKKAVPRSDTATVVRTSPNAADTARNAAGSTAPSNDATAPVTTSATTGSGEMAKPVAVRKARADRN